MPTKAKNEKENKQKRNNLQFLKIMYKTVTSNQLSFCLI